MTSRYRLIVFLSVLALVLAGCSERDAGETSSEREQSAGEHDPLLADAEFGRYLLREVGLSHEELDREATEQLYEEFVAELLFAEAAKDAGIALDPERVVSERRRLEALEAGGSKEELTLEARRRLLARAYEDELLAAEILVTPEEVETRLGRPQRRSARSHVVFRQILVEDKSAAQAAHRRIVRQGESFVDVAQEVSVGPDAGEPQQVPLANLPEPAARALSRLPEGGISRPVEVGRYYYLFQLDARNRDPDPGRARERETAEHAVFQEKLEELRARRLEELARIYTVR